MSKQKNLMGKTFYKLKVIGKIELSKKYGICKQNVYNIIKRKAWVHVK